MKRGDTLRALATTLDEVASILFRVADALRVEALMRDAEGRSQ